MSLSRMVFDAMVEGSALRRFRKSLSEQDQTALDNTLSTLREYEMGTALGACLSPFETLLLLTLGKQNQRIECLEFLLQQNAARRLEI